MPGNDGRALRCNSHFEKKKVGSFKANSEAVLLGAEGAVMSMYCVFQSIVSDPKQMSGTEGLGERLSRQEVLGSMATALFSRGEEG